MYTIFVEPLAAGSGGIGLLQRLSKRLPKPVRFVLALFLRASQDHVSAYAAGASFFIILALVPALMLLAALLRFTPLSQADLMDAIGGLVPAAFLPLVQYVSGELFSGSSIALISVVAVAAAWSASRGVYGVMVGMNAIFHTHDRRSYLTRRLLCVGYTLILLLALLCTLTLHVFGRLLIAALDRHFPRLTNELALVSALRFVFTLAFLTLVFTLIYRVFPARHATLRVCTLCAFLAALGWLLFSSLFSVYVSHFSGYATFYGSLATVALFLLWLYFCITILLLGGVLASMLLRGDPAAGPPGPRT